MRHENDGFCAMLAGVLDGGKSANNALIIGYFVAVERDVEVDLDKRLLSLEHSDCNSAGNWIICTRIKTRLSLGSTSVIASLFERDIVEQIEGLVLCI